MSNNRNGNSRTQEIIDVIISAIKKGAMAPGEKLPSQQEMSRLFGVSRTVIRDALKTLEGRQILQTTKGSGTYVNPFLSANLELDRAWAPGTTIQATTGDILNLSRLIWIEALRLIVRSCPLGDIKNLEQMTNTFYQQFTVRTPMHERYIHETTFGLTVVKMSGNKFYQQIMHELFKVNSDIDHKIVADYNCYREILEIDRMMVEALSDRDAARACFLGRERDLLIDKIIAKEPCLLSKPCRINLSLSR
ncbi:MAG: FadR family transcriptional regulator [Clostridia bacterium]|nr:FadR family transcriptional regulator [Clostridia bacterium]